MVNAYIKQRHCTEPMFWLQVWYVRNFERGDRRDGRGREVEKDKERTPTLAVLDDAWRMVVVLDRNDSSFVQNENISFKKPFTQTIIQRSVLVQLLN